MKHMVIAPGEPVDRAWFEATHAGLRWMPRSEAPFAFEPVTDPFRDTVSEPLRATLHTYHHPGWRILLRFFVDDRLGVVRPAIPRGYVLPGSVQGVELEHSCLECMTEWPRDWCYHRQVRDMPW